MRILHVSFVKIKLHDPQSWLTTISYFTGILEVTAQRHEVHSIHTSHRADTMEHRNVHYHFVSDRAGLHSVVRNLKPDVIVIHGLHCAWRVLRFVKTFRHTMIFAQHHAEQPLRFIKGWLQARSDRYIRGYFFTSKQFGQKWVEEGLISSMEKVHEVMEVSTQFQPEDKREARSKLKMDLSKRVFIWVGRLDENKDPRTLIEGFTHFAQEHRDVALYVISQSKQIPDFLLAPHKQIHFVGTVRHADMECWYRAADFVISTSHFEGSGVAVCEGMACGCVPVVTRIPSFESMTGQGRIGLLFKAGDAEELFDALMKSTSMDLEIEKTKVTEFFVSNLSFQAIASRMIEAFSR